MAQAKEPLLFESPCASQRLRAAEDYLRALPRDQGVLIVAGSQLAPQWLLARCFVQGKAEARFNWHRKSLRALVDELALPQLAQEARAPLRGLGRLGLCTRVVHLLHREERLGRYAQIAFTPGFVRALAQTLSELRMARIGSAELASHDPDLARLLAGYEAELERLMLADTAHATFAATEATRARHRFRGLPLLLLDVELAHLAEAELLRGLCEGAAGVCATFVRGDERAEGYLRIALGGATRVRRSEPEGDSDLSRLQARLFEAGDVARSAGDRPRVKLLSSPGESREAVEVARAILAAGAEGVAFDRIAVVLRAAEVYRAPIEEAFTRAELPAYFAEGVRRPLPEGRALLLLLECAREGLSRRAFAEYLSLFVFPRPEDEQVKQGASRWERLLLRAGVGGDVARWRRRLGSLREQLLARIDEPHAEESEREDARRDLNALDHLVPFVESLLPELEALTRAETWGGLLAGLTRLSQLALAEADSVCEALTELAPLSELGPVSIVDAERILAQRLGSTVLRSTGHGAGKVFVGTPDELRGRSFERVFVLGLAEQLFPPRLSEDPLLPDRVRRALSPELPVLEERAARERLLLRLCVGAAERELTLTYPRFDAEHGRPRVPSFYGLAVLHAVDGTLPAFDELARRASPGAAARMGFPAPDAPEQSIDDAEYDLAVLGQLLRAPPAERVGGLRYLLSHPHLARALRFRARRWSVPRFTPCDGLVVQDEAGRALLASYQLDKRAYSASHLALMATCPYRFYLQAIQGLRLRESEEPGEALGARERGVLMHRVQQLVLAELSTRGQLPLSASTLPEAVQLLRQRFTALALELAEQRGLSSTRPWTDSLASLQHDLEEWLRLMLYETTWIPQHFELGFGVTKERNTLDAHSVSTPVRLDKLLLTGVIDLVERRATPDAEGRALFRVTDYKSGRHEQKLAITAGGRALQPLLYGLAVEQLFPGARVEAGRLYFCTSRGDFESDPVPLDVTARAVFGEWQGALDALLREGLLPAAPAKDACAHCPGLAVCGPYEEKERVPQVKAKDMKRLLPLHQLRNLP